jgi:hypothetical protein
MGFWIKQADAHSSLGFLQYINGNKDAALKEFDAARRLDADFKKQFDATLSWVEGIQTHLGRQRLFG